MPDYFHTSVLMKIHWINDIMNIPQTNKQRKDQRNKNLTKETCKRNFNTARGLTQHQRKCKSSNNINNITVPNITVQTSSEIKIWGDFSIMNHTRLTLE